jgi:hypothetical protein
MHHELWTAHRINPEASAIDLIGDGFELNL